MSFGISDPLGEDWMENPSSLEQLLGLEGSTPLTLQSLAPEPEENVIVQEILAPSDSHVDTKSNNILHNLLTVPIQQLSDQTNTLSALDLLEDDNVNDFVGHIISVPELSSDSNGAQVNPEIVLESNMDYLGTDQDLSESSFLFDQCADEIMKSPLSASEVENLLSGSEPSSPEQCISDPDYCPSDEDYKPPSVKRTSKSKSSKQPKTKGSKSSRASPYEVPFEVPTEGMSKKERKKLQNKNAAIRYRMKKRSEMGVVKSEEDTLLSRNVELKDQVDTLNREIKYMKDLMTEVFKAKGLKITFKT